MTLFSVTSALGTWVAPDGCRDPLIFVSAFAARAGKGVFLFLEKERRCGMDRKRDSAYALVKDDVFPSLVELTFRKDRMTINGQTTSVHLLRSRGGAPAGRLTIADQDPSVKGWLGLYNFTFESGVIKAVMLICDAPSVELVFQKI